MARPHTTSARSHSRGEGQNHTPVGRVLGVIRRWRERGAERRLGRLLTPRSRRALAERLRRIARDANDRRPRRGLDMLLPYRAAAVRTELLEIAALLEQVHDPDPACVHEIHELLANGDSPLYHRGVHVSELYATLYYLRAGLLAKDGTNSASSPQDQAIQPGRPNHQRSATAASDGL
jgi:hypothetical protein